MRGLVVGPQGRDGQRGGYGPAGPPGATGPAGPAGGHPDYTAVNKDGSTISKGMVTSVHSSGTGVIRAQADSVAHAASGIAEANILNTFSGLIQTAGQFTLADWTAVTGTVTLANKATYFLDPTNPGKLTTTAPSTPGQVVQIIGYAIDTTTLDLVFSPPILL